MRSLSIMAINAARRRINGRKLFDDLRGRWPLLEQGTGRREEADRSGLRLHDLLRRRQQRRTLYSIDFVRENWARADYVPYQAKAWRDLAVAPATRSAGGHHEVPRAAMNSMPNISTTASRRRRSLAHPRRPKEYPKNEGDALTAQLKNWYQAASTSGTSSISLLQ